MSQSERNCEKKLEVAGYSELQCDESTLNKRNQQSTGENLKCNFYKLKIPKFPGLKACLLYL